MIWLGVIGKDIKGRRFLAWNIMLQIGAVGILKILMSLHTKYQRP